jgi:hypothetical protein
LWIIALKQCIDEFRVGGKFWQFIKTNFSSNIQRGLRAFYSAFQMTKSKWGFQIFCFQIGVDNALIVLGTLFFFEKNANFYRSPSSKLPFLDYK